MHGIVRILSSNTHQLSTSAEDCVRQFGRRRRKRRAGKSWLKVTSGRVICARPRNLDTSRLAQSSSQEVDGDYSEFVQLGSWSLRGTGFEPPGNRRERAWRMRV